MKKLLTVVLVCLRTVGFAQTEYELIKATIDKVFTGMRQNDTTLIRQSLHPTCFLKSVGKNKAGETHLQESLITDWLKSVGTRREGVVLDEKLLAYDIKTDGDMAVAWTPYEFYVSDRFNHCGVNVFTLMKTDKGWKIIGIVDTRRKDDCKK